MGKICPGEAMTWMMSGGISPRIIWDPLGVATAATPRHPIVAPSFLMDRSLATSTLLHNGLTVCQGWDSMCLQKPSRPYLVPSLYRAHYADQHPKELWLHNPPLVWETPCKQSIRVVR